MPSGNSYEAAQGLLALGWRVERVRIVAANGSSRQGWEWTSPEGEVTEVIGKWQLGPTKPRKPRRKTTDHMIFKRLNARTEIFLARTLPVPCPACGEPYPERSLVPYAGERCCLSCLLRRKTSAEREEYRRATLAARALSYMEDAMSVMHQNAPEIVP